MTSAIHDIGYQRYDGVRLGAGAAWRALFRQGVRALFGLGRPARAKVLPVLMLGLSTLPAIFTVAVTAIVSNRAPVPIGHANLFSAGALLYLLFAAAQAPELFSRDQANRVLPLMLSRDLTRWQYGTARLCAVFAALLLLGLVPHLVLWVGGIGTASDTWAALQDRAGLLLPILASTSLAALLLGSVASAIAACTSRRFLATAAIAGLFIVMAAMNAALSGVDTVSPAVAELVNPLGVLGSASRLMFPASAMPMAGAMGRGMAVPVPETESGLAVYTAVLLVYAGLAIAVVRWRVQRVDA